MEFLLVLVVLAVVVFVVTGPLRRDRAARAREGVEPAGPDRTRRLAELDAAREAKYREIRDADLDHRTGKLSDADFEAIDGALRAEAVEILRAMDRQRDTEPPAHRNPPA